MAELSPVDIASALVREGETHSANDAAAAEAFAECETPGEASERTALGLCLPLARAIAHESGFCDGAIRNAAEALQIALAKQMVEHAESIAALLWVVLCEKKLGQNTSDPGVSSDILDALSQWQWPQLKQYFDLASLASCALETFTSAKHEHLRCEDAVVLAQFLCNTRLCNDNASCSLQAPSSHVAASVENRAAYFAATACRLAYELCDEHTCFTNQAIQKCRYYSGSV